MTKRAALKNATNPKLAARFWHLASAHKVLSIVTCLFIVLAATISIAKYNAYHHKFSDKDYARLDIAAGGVLEKINTGPIDKSKGCRYHSPEKYKSDRLYCSIEMATYMPYESDTHVRQIAQRVEREARTLGSTSSNLSTLFAKPTNTIADVFVKLTPPLPDKSCRFEIITGDVAKNVSAFLPKKSEDNLIAIHFYCSPESRKEYFPIRNQ